MQNCVVFVNASPYRSSCFGDLQKIIISGHLCLFIKHGVKASGNKSLAEEKKLVSPIIKKKIQV